jgi:hypothetical protein
VRFCANFRVFRDNLWKCLGDNGYVARYDSTSHVGVNVRYYWDPLATEPIKMEDRGKCIHKNVLCEKCKVVSLLCFVSGKVVITGLKTRTEAESVAEFIEWFYKTHYASIAETPLKIASISSKSSSSELTLINDSLIV